MFKDPCEIYAPILIIESPLGLIKAEADLNGIKSLQFLPEGYEATNTEFITDNNYLNQLLRELNEYFEGNLKEFSVKLSLNSTTFNNQIRQLLTKIPYASTISYKELSKMYGDEKAIRAVANANASNPILLVIPCHRVIGSDNSLTGYAAGLKRKEWLLNHERKHSSLDYQASLF